MATFQKLCVTPKVYKKVMIDCMQEFIKHHPEYRDLKVSQNVLINKLAEFYLRPLLIDQEVPK